MGKKHTNSKMGGISLKQKKKEIVIGHEWFLSTVQDIMKEDYIRYIT